MTKKPRKRRESFGAIRKLPSGRYQASYVGTDGIRYPGPHTYDTISEARVWLAAQRVALHSGEWSAHRAATTNRRTTETFAEYAANWIRTRTGRHGTPLAPRTKEGYQCLLDGKLSYFAHKRLTAIDPPMVRAWYAEQVATGKITQSARAYGLLSSVLNTAVQDGLISSNPCTIRGARNAATGRKVEPPTDAELEIILNHIDPRFKAMILISAWGAARYGEVTELRRKDLNTIEQDGQRFIQITISRGVSYITGRGFVVGGTKSKAGNRVVLLPPHLTPDIEAHLAHPGWVGDGEDALLFPAASGGHLFEPTWTRKWFPARAAAGREDMPFHALRHFGATKFAQTGATLKELQARLGHATVHTAMRYQHEGERSAELVTRMSQTAER